MPASAELRLVEEPAGGDRRRRVSQAASVGGHHLEHPKAGPGERGHARLAVSRQDGDGRRDVAGSLARRDQNGAVTPTPNPPPPRGAQFQPRADLRERALEPSERSASCSPSVRHRRLQDFSLEQQ